VRDAPFDWDPKKAKENLAKHRVSFEEASTVFYDEQALEMADPDEASDEDRFVIIGLRRPLAAPRGLPLHPKRKPDPNHLGPAGG